MMDAISSQLMRAMGHNKSITIFRPTQVGENGEHSDWVVWGDRHVQESEFLVDALDGLSEQDEAE